MNQSIDSYLTDFGVSESVDGEEVVTLRMGCLYTRWDEIGSVSSGRFLGEDGYKHIVVET